MRRGCAVPGLLLATLLAGVTLLACGGSAEQPEIVGAGVSGSASESGGGGSTTSEAASADGTARADDAGERGPNADASFARPGGEVPDADASSDWPEGEVPDADDLKPWPRVDTPTTAERTIGWTEAHDHVGEVMAVEGRIVDTHNTGGACFLNYTEDWQGKFYLAILGSNMDDYPQSPELWFHGKRVRVVGKIEIYRDRPQIVVESPAHVTLLDEGDGSPPPGPPVVPWTEAKDHVGETITVEGEIVDTHDSGRAVFLNFTTDWQGKFYLAILGDDVNDYPAPPAAHFLHKRIRATGEVQMHRGRPQIVIDSPDRITILD